MEYVKLKDICFFLPKSKIKAGEGMDNGKYIFFTSSDTKVSKINEYLYDDEAVIIGTGGKPSCNYCKGKFSVSTDNFVLKSNTINIKYLYYFLRNNNLSILEKGFHGAGLKHISKDYVSDINVPLLDYSKQCKIVSTLDSIYININFYKDQLKNFDNIVKSQFIEMFGDPIQNEKAWNSSILNEVTDVRDGTHDSPKYHDRGYPFVTSKNLIDGKIDFSTCQFISEKDYLHFNDRSRIDDGDILMPMIGTIGGAIIVKKDREFSIKNVALIKFTKDNTKINRTFILYILNSDSMNNYFELTKKGGTQKFMALGVIRNIPIIVPPIELQNEFAKFVNQIDKSKFIIQKQIKLLEELLEKKMNEYFGD